MNIVTLIGVLAENPVLREFESGFKGSFITLRVAKPFKNLEGNTDFDYIKCCLWEGIAQNTCDYCSKGDTIAIRGRLSTYTEEVMYMNNNNEIATRKAQTLQCIVERVFFISTSRLNKTSSITSEPYQDLVEEEN